jgi:F420-dependent oxidoreductase-like protein
MRIGIWIGAKAPSLAHITGEVQGAAKVGYASAWLGGNDGWDALTTLAVAGTLVPGIGLGTAIVTTYPRHPLILASQALSVQAATGNRLTLGIGVSNRFVIEGQYGYSFDKPARHLREYLSALVPLLHGQAIGYQGSTIKAAGAVEVPGATPPPVLVAALAPAMLQIAGELADGTITNWATPTAISDHIAPAITKAAASRPAPRIVAATFVCVTDDEPGRRAQVAEQFGRIEQVPSYRAILDRGGAAGVQDAVIVGDEASVTSQLQRMADAGTTELVAHPLGTGQEQARTVKTLTAFSQPEQIVPPSHR